MPHRDFINKRVEDINSTTERWFGLAKQDWVIFMLVLSLIGNILLVVKIIGITEDYSNKIVEEVRRQVPKEVEQQITPIQQNVDTVTKRVLEAIPNKPEDESK